jgi:SGNH hydrolase-like domain, acetyltransferase AlgX
MIKKHIRVLIHKIQIVIIVLFFCVLWLSQFKLGDAYLLENRRLYELPKLIKDFDSKLVSNKQDILEFPAQTEFYFNDRFPHRNRLLSYFRYFQFRLNRGKPPVNNVARGGGGHYFYQSDFDLNHICADLLTDEELQETVDEIIKRRDFCAKQNKKYYFLITAVKTDIYPEYLPENWSPLKSKNFPITPADQVYEALKSAGVDVYYNKSDLLTLKQEQEVFSKFDTHWSSFAAYSTYNNMWSGFEPELKLQIPEKDFTFELDTKEIADIERFSGTTLLSEGEYMPRFNNKQGTLFEPPSTIKIHPDKPNVYIYSSHRNNSKSKKLLVFDTSYHIKLEPFYSETFGEIRRYKTGRDFHTSLVVKSDADIVLQEMNSLNLDVPLPKMLD